MNKLDELIFKKRLIAICVIVVVLAITTVLAIIGMPIPYLAADAAPHKASVAVDTKQDNVIAIKQEDKVIAVKEVIPEPEPVPEPVPEPTPVSRRKGATRSMVLEVSAYNPADATQCSGTGLAADGKRAIPGRTIAVDPRVIPFGSEIYVPGYGWFLAHDTGGYIKGNRVDVALATNKECFALGRRNMECLVVLP